MTTGWYQPLRSAPLCSSYPSWQRTSPSLPPITQGLIGRKGQGQSITVLFLCTDQSRQERLKKDGRGIIPEEIHLSTVIRSDRRWGHGRWQPRLFLELQSIDYVRGWSNGSIQWQSSTKRKQKWFQFCFHCCFTQVFDSTFRCPWCVLIGCLAAVTRNK